MKNLILSITLFCFGQFNAQCVKLYVKEHLSGSQICLLGEEDYIEICEDFNEVNGCPRDFYIYKKGFSSGSLTYELSLDKGWATHYMTLMVNPTTKRFGFILQGQTAMYSYYTESEMESIRARQSENERIVNQTRAEQAKMNDEKTKIEINSALERKDYFNALQLFNLLNYKDDNLLVKINAGWLPEKEHYNKIYEEYTAEFNRVKKEYFTSKKDFYAKYNNSIKSKEISINGKEAYLKRIASTSDLAIKVQREKILNRDGYVYLKSNNKHFVCPVGINGNYYTGRYNEQLVNKLNISILYDTVANTYVPYIEFYKDEKKISTSPIVNTNVFQTNYFSMTFPMEINALYQKVINESGRRILESLYPQQIIHFDTSESISFSGLSNIPYPGDGKRNDKYETLQIEFEIVLKDVEKLSNVKNIILTENFYNPSILYLVKKLYPDADTLVFAFGDYKSSLGNLGLHIDFSHMSWEQLKRQVDKGGSFVPLTKGVIELKNNKFIIYDKMGNYKEVEAHRILPESKVTLTNLELDKLKLDSTFIKNVSDGYYTRDGEYIAQFPIFFKQLELRSDEKKADFKVNDNLILKLLPIYLNPNLAFPSISEPLYYPISTLALNFNARNIGTGQDQLEARLDEPANKYFQEMSHYFEYQNEANSKKAIKSLTKANQYLESFKQYYFNPFFGPVSK
jgi:hypothetical protein